MSIRDDMTARKAELERRLALCRSAEEEILTTGQSYSVDDLDLRRQLTHADLARIQKTIRYLENQVMAVSSALDGRGSCIFAG